MTPDREIAFWRQRWDTRQIGFHEGKANELLEANVSAFDGCRRVLVPLCGKAVDMMFLAARGIEVVGVEAVESACRAFFDDNALPAVVEERDGFRAFCGGGVTLLCGDMFDATPARLGTFDAVYDRASLVALQPALRARYVETVTAMMQPGARMFLVAFSYDQSKIDGPPWSVDDDVVRALFAAFAVERLATHICENRPKFVEAGVDELRETAFLLVKRA